ncbi:MAG: shikimate kinase [Oscillospiraceae bacterium]|nr:shikimate kinase [Oscillospiraceae bacterium]
MKRFGLLGESLAHSFSPFIHAQLGGYEYRLYEKKREELDGFFMYGDFDGINVTFPYKKEVLKYCRSVSGTAQLTGSVNTIIRLPCGDFHGENTDFFGFCYLLKKTGVNISGKKAVVLGSGGSSLTVRAVLNRFNPREVIVVSRSGAENYGNIHRHSDAQIIINTTPAGMYPNNGVSPVSDSAIFKNCEAAVDLIYNPAHTEFLAQAEELGIPCFNGLSMLTAQAKKSAEYFTGTNISDEKIEDITAKTLKKTRNIILIGMPGCGKSSIGRALAEKSNREFADSDEWIEKKSKKSIPEIFSDCGEEVFRKLETEALETLCKLSGLVIAAGGGVVTTPRNRRIIRQNGLVIYLTRELSDLPVCGRPLSEKQGVEALAAVRLPLFESWSDCKIPVSGIAQTAAEIYYEFL